MIPLLLLLAAAPTAAPSTDAFMDAARKIEQGLRAGDPEALKTRLDMAALAERSIRDIESPADFKKGFIKGASKNSLATNLAAALSQGARLKFLKLVGDPKSPRAVYRFLHENGGINYYEMYLARQGDQVVITDVFTFSTGERFTETLRRAFATAAAQANQGVLDRLLGKERDLIVHSDKIQAMTQLMQEQRFEETVKAFNALPASLKKDRMVLLIRMQAAAALSPEENEKAVTEFEKAYPGDPALALFSIDVAYNRKDYAAALASVDRLDARVKDPYLQVLRANVFIEQKKYAEAKKAAQSSIDAEPELADPYWSLVTVSLATKDHAETARLLELVEKKLHLEIGDLTQIPEYAEFVKSAAYKAWLKKRAG